jgi:hypothetical protein
MPSPTSSNPCPICGNPIPIPDTCVGMWDGKKPDGTKAHGGIFETKCSGCGVALISYWEALESVVTWRTNDGKIKNPN